MRRMALIRAVPLFAAMCFALLVGLHLARPVATAPTELTQLGFTAADICGYGESETSRCPACVIATTALLPGDLPDRHPDLYLREQTYRVTEPGLVPVLRRQAPRSRGPPAFT